MKRPVPTFHGDVGMDGRFVWQGDETPARQMWIRSLAGQRVDVTITEHRDRRSEQANAYLWGHVYEEASKHLGDGDMDAEEIHDAMCALFLPNEQKRVEFFNRLTGDSLTVDCTDTRRSSKLKGDEFYTFVERVRKKLLELGVETKDPDPQYWRKRASVEAA